MGTWPKVALLAAAAVAAVVLLVVLRPRDDDNEVQPTGPDTSVVTTTVTESSGETTTTTTTTTTEEEAVRAEIVVQGGEVSGPEQIELDQGQRLVLVVRADVTDEVHVHGYDLLKDVGPGEPARFNFRVTDPGRFDVELEQRQQRLTELVVSP